MNGALWTLCGFAAGASIVVVWVILNRRNRTVLAERFSEESKTQREHELAAIIDQLKDSFAALSREAISTNSEEFLKLAATRLEKQTAQGEQVLDSKKKLIDARLEELRTRLDALNNLIQAAERERAESVGKLGGQLEKATQATHHLHETTAKLNEALSNPQRRGQWGERMADDVLRLVGLVEGVNYSKQRKLADGTIPDFTFHLPSGRLVHMDVKFPLANYLKMLDATEDPTRDTLRVQFLRDVRTRVKEVTSRAYIDPANDTVDYVLVFIPNEQVYGFIHEHDNTLLDYALERKVVLCSPWTLYAVLSVIRQAAANFRLERACQGRLCRIRRSALRSVAVAMRSVERRPANAQKAPRPRQNLPHRSTVTSRVPDQDRDSSGSRCEWVPIMRRGERLMATDGPPYPIAWGSQHNMRGFSEAGSILGISTNVLVRKIAMPAPKIAAFMPKIATPVPKSATATARITVSFARRPWCRPWAVLSFGCREARRSR